MNIAIAERVASSLAATSPDARLAAFRWAYSKKADRTVSAELRRRAAAVERAIYADAGARDRAASP